MNASSIRHSSIPRLAAAGLAVTLTLALSGPVASAEGPETASLARVDAGEINPSGPAALPTAPPAESPAILQASSSTGTVSVTQPPPLSTEPAPAPPSPAVSSGASSNTAVQMSPDVGMASNVGSGTWCVPSPDGEVCVSVDFEPPSPTPPVQATGPVPSGPVGVPPGTALTVHNGDLTITTAGTVINGLDIRGFVKVMAPNVTIRNSVIRGAATSVQRALLLVASDSASVLIEDSELYAAQPSPWIDGIRGWNITARRVNIHHVIDSMHLYGDNVTVESSWLHDNMHYTNDPAQGGGASHDDSIQIQRGSNIRITGNTISGAYNTGIQFTQDQGVVSDVQIRNNWMDGGGCTVNLAEKGRGPFQGVVISDNIFGRNTRVSNCAIISPSTTVLTAERNFFTDGAVATVRRGD